jgi:hypothetical protein
VFEPRDDETRRAEPVATPRFELRPILRAAGVGVVLGLSIWLFFGTAPEDRALLESALRELPARVASLRP